MTDKKDMTEWKQKIKSVKYFAGNLIRWVNAPWRQHTIPISEARTHFGSGFGPEGWHPLVETFKLYQVNPALDWKNTPLFLFLKNFTPHSICDLLETGQTDEKTASEAGIKPQANLPLFHYPWGTFTRKTSPKDPWRSRFCGPSSDEFIREEFERSIRLFERIRKEGYRPWKLGGSFISGTFLISSKGDKRFIVLQGNHRMAALAALGVLELPVRIIPSLYLDYVLEDGMDHWPLVEKGLCARNTAKAVFDLYFKENGHHIRHLLHGHA